jgi:peptidoglycan lytic transglycosylase G
VSGRTPEEREQARIERERRRAMRGEATSGAPLPAPWDASPADEPSRADVSGRAPDHEPSPEPAPEPQPTLEPVVSTPGPIGHAGGFHEQEEEDGDDGSVEPLALDGDYDHDDEAPAGTRRISGLQRGRRNHPIRRKRRPPRQHAGGRGRLRLGRGAALLAILIAAAFIWFLVQLFQPFHGSGHGRVTVRIPAHASSSEVGDLLAHEGVISSSFFFELRATLAGKRSDLRSGTYRLKQDMSYSDVLTVLTTAPRAAKVTELTLTEGKTRRQISALLHAQGIRGNYLAETRHSRLLNPTKYGAPRDTPTLEGFLFPSTYQLIDPIRTSAIVSDQLKEFRKQFAKVNFGYARSKHLTPYDVLKIASIIEAEAGTAHDQPLVASVVYNRLKARMPLQMDATTRYATGNYTKPLTDSELNSSSPYNTRIHKGLPPTPISNPGLAAIEAAAHPRRTNYLYFVVKPCGNGQSVFTASYQDFLHFQQLYQSARAAHGGRSPTNC